MYDLIIIGNGIAAQCFLWELSKSPKKISVLKISDEALAPRCSINSTATICLRGVKAGVSPLGDEIFNSYQMAESFITSEKPDGVTPGKFYSLCEDEEKDEFIRRFGNIEEIEKPGGHTLKSKYFGKTWDGYVFHPDKFLQFMSKKTEETHLAISGMVVATEITRNEVSITTLDGKNYKAKKLLLCSGAYTKIYEKLFPQHDAIIKSRPIPGAYLEKSKINLGQNSFVISRFGENFIYDGENKILKIGSTTEKNGNMAPDFKALMGIWASFRDLIREEIPSFEEFEIKVGVRHKGPMRMPFYGKLEDRVFAFMNLYKNGFNFPFKGAKEILEII